VGRSFLILHGIENHRPRGHWQHWLAERLRSQGHRVLYPGLPDPDEPSLPVWEAGLLTHLDELKGQESVVVCHSLACLLWFSVAKTLTEERRVDRLMLVSPPEPKRIPESGASFRTELDPVAVRSSVRGEIAIACSDHDPFNPPGAQAMYGDPLGVEAHVFDGGGHITPDSGYGPWPFIEAWCLE
jgi:predicted alpha/beta hydrolase family esterase